MDCCQTLTVPFYYTKELAIRQLFSQSFFYNFPQEIRLKKAVSLDNQLGNWYAKLKSLKG